VAFADDAALERGVRIVAPARPGIGSSDRCRDRCVADWASDMSALVAALGIDHFSVLGWSAGGPFALAVAAGLAPLVVHTATVGGMAPLRSPLSARQLGLILDQVLFPLAARNRSLAAVVVRVSALAPTGVERRVLLCSLPPEDRAVVEKMSPADVADGLHDALRHGPGGIADDYAVLAAEWGFELADVGGPVTVFQGAADTLLPMSHAEALAARLPRAGSKSWRGRDTSCCARISGGCSTSWSPDAAPARPPDRYSTRMAVTGGTRAADHPGAAAIRFATTSTHGTTATRASAGTIVGADDPRPLVTVSHAQRPAAMPRGMPTSSATTPMDDACHATTPAT
jgi:pimeloyl-ACP methyl ester carboxylesterase